LGRVFGTLFDFTNSHEPSSLFDTNPFEISVQVCIHFLIKFCNNRFIKSAAISKAISPNEPKASNGQFDSLHAKAQNTDNFFFFASLPMSLVCHATRSLSAQDYFTIKAKVKCLLLKLTVKLQAAAAAVQFTTKKVV
jgi:hypothetical protein